MYQNKYTISTDLKRKMTSVVPRFVQYDKAVLIFKVYDNGIPFPIEDVTDIEVTNLRPDGKAIVGFGEPVLLEDNSWAIRYTYLGSEMRKIGTNKVGLSMFNGKEKVSILPFNVEIVQDLREIAGSSQSEEDVGALTQLIQSVKVVLEEATEVIKEANQAIHDVQVEIENATELGDRLEQEIINSKDATEKSIIATDEARVVIQQAIDINEESLIVSEEARIQGSFAKEQGEFAQIQGTEAQNKALFAQEQGDYAKEQGLYAKEKADYAEQVTADIEQANTDLSNIKLEAVEATQRANEQADRAEVATDRVEPLIVELENELPNITNLKHVGVWSESKEYKKNEEVLFNKSTYRATVDNIGVQPSNDKIEWQLIAQGGTDGQGAVSTVNNIQPDENGNVDLGNLAKLDDSDILIKTVQSNMQNLQLPNLKNIMISNSLPSGEFPEGTILIKRSDV